MKNFETKIEKQFENFTLKTPNTSQYIEHYYADFVEIYALFSKEEVSMSDIFDYVFDVNDKNIVEKSKIEISSNEIASNEAENNDDVSEKIRTIFNICNERKNLFNEDEYPFSIEDNIIKLKPNLSSKQKLYLYLLISSSLNIFNIVDSEITDDFELISYYCLKYFLTSKSVIKKFGANSDYTGNTISKINQLIADLGLKPNEENINDISTKNIKERGLDLVAWLPFKDKIPNMLIFMFQCACGKNWESKQGETELFSNYMYFNINPIHGMFVPYSMSKTDNRFYQFDRIKKVLFFDRKRIIEQFENCDFLSDIQSLKIIEKSLSIRITF